MAMNARRFSRLILLTFGMIALLNLCLASASGEWYRPMTWGDKKPAVKNSHAKKKPGGVVGGTKRAISKTADALTPWDNKKKKDNPIDGAGRFFRPDLAHKKQNEASWYRPATWFRSEPEPAEKPLTVTDWMAQERPEFENR
jgi:hypothetical protein